MLKIFITNLENKIHNPFAGADPGTLVGGVDFFFKGMGSGGRLKAPVGPGQSPVGGTGGEVPGSS